MTRITLKREVVDDGLSDHRIAREMDDLEQPSITVIHQRGWCEKNNLRRIRENVCGGATDEEVNR